MRLRNPGWWLIAAAVPLVGQGLVVRLTGDQLKIAAPNLRFLEGKLLDRLRAGNVVVYAAHLSLVGDNEVGRTRTIERCATSYDLWEEKFAVARLGVTPRQSMSHLTTAGAEAWCLDQVSLRTGGLRENEPFRLRLELQGEDDAGAKATTDSSLILSRLIDLFSRPAPAGSPRWIEESGRLLLQELRNTRRK
jgi:hypothetical protein